jgi:hypothetical membrane protein
MRIALAIGRGLVLVAIGVVVALHVVRPELDPVAHRLSDYANGDHGWLMAVAFAVLAASMLVLAPIVAATGRTPRRRRAIQAAMVVAAVGLAAAGIFRTGVSRASLRASERFSSVRQAGTLSDDLHGLTSSAATIALVVAAVLSGRRGIAALAAALLVTSPLLHRTAVAGLDQRVLWAVVLTWVLTSARIPDRLSSSSAPPRTMFP